MGAAASVDSAASWSKKGHHALCDLPAPQGQPAGGAPGVPFWPRAPPKSLVRAPVLAGTCRHLEQEHRCDAHHPHLVPCQEPSQLAPTAHSLASASAQASDGAQPGFPEQSQRHQREQQRCLQVPLRAFQYQKRPNLTPGAFVDAQSACFGALSTVGPRNVSKRAQRACERAEALFRFY